MKHTRKDGTPFSKEEFLQKLKIDKEFNKEFGGNGIDQIAEMMGKLQNRPDDRRNMVTAWNPAEVDAATLPPCFLGCQLISTKNGYLPIKSVNVGELVLTEDGSFKEVYETHSTPYSGEIIEIKVQGITETIKCTPNHPFLSEKSKGFIESEKLEIEDYLAIPINKKNIIPTVNYEHGRTKEKFSKKLEDEKFWYLMGFFLGDGWIRESRKEIFFSINNKDKNKVLPILEKSMKLYENKNLGKNVKKYSGNKLEIYHILSKFGSGALNKIIPQFVHDAPIHLISKFIDGYIAADGSVTNDGTSITTISPHIAYGIQLLYAKLGVKALVYHQKRPEKTIIEDRVVNQNNTYSINVYKNKNQTKSWKIDKKFLWLRISEIIKRKVENETVYNLSVKENHTYTVQNIVNHNCHYGFQVWTRELSLDERFDYWFNNSKPNRDAVDHYDTLSDEEKHERLNESDTPKRAISLMWNQRSCDTPLGIPFNIASYGAVLQILAQLSNMIPEELIGNLGDTHIYLNQTEGVIEQIERNSHELPTLKINTKGITDPAQLKFEDFELLNYVSEGKIEFPLSN